MKILILLLCLSTSAFADWKTSLDEFALKNVVHQSWGYSHGLRNYHKSIEIAQRVGLEIDLDVLLAASMLHDIGGLPGFELPHVDHGVRSAEIAIPLLKEWGFPAEKLNDVKAMIIDHVYSNPAPIAMASKIFRDADMLDFLGPIGVSRLMAANLEMGSSPDLANSVKVIESMNENLPDKFAFASSKKEGLKKIESIRGFMKTLETEALKGRAY